MFCFPFAVTLFTPLASPLTAEANPRRLISPLPPQISRFASRYRPCRPCYCKQQQQEKQEEEEEERFQVLTAIKSTYNDIVILETPKSRMLLLDSTHNVHSVLQKGDEKWTGSYWDEFASLPPIVPQGPIAIYGLGGGTAAHLMLDVWPSLQLQGWEIDGILIDRARDYFELSNLERCNKDGGGLQIHIDDIFSTTKNLPEGYAGIIVDLFSDGKVLSQLEEVETWLELSDRLMPNGRFMVNCGGSAIDGKMCHESVDDIWTHNSTIKALAAAFPGQVNWKIMSEKQGRNFLALTGPLPDITTWSTEVPGYLSEAVKQWRPCTFSP